MKGSKLSVLALGSAWVCLIFAMIRFPVESEPYPVMIYKPRPAVQTVTVTGYCKNRCCTGRWARFGLTASGRKPIVGVTAAGAREWKADQVVLIPGLGYRTIEDRGSAVDNWEIDVMFDTHQEALAWGRRRIEVEVIK